MTTEEGKMTPETTQATEPQPSAPPAPLRLLNQEERNDLRKRVLNNEELSLEDAKAVIDTIRNGRGAAALSAESKPKKSRSKKAGMTDEALASSLDAKLGSLGKK